MLTDAAGYDHPSYRSLLAHREFFGLYASFTLTTVASTMSGFALGSLVHSATGNPLLTSIAMFGSTFMTVMGALTLMSVADGTNPRRTLLALQSVTLLAFAVQAWPGLALQARFAILLAVGFGQSLNTGVRMGVLAEAVPRHQYALARSLMNITSGSMQILGYAIGAALLTVLTFSDLFMVSASAVGLALVLTSITIRKRSVRLTRRPGLAATWRANRALFARRGARVLLLNLWVPNGLIVGCESLLLSYDAAGAGAMLATGSAGMLVGDLTVGRLITPEQRRAWAYPLRILLAAPFLVFALHPPTLACCLVLFLSSAGFAATLPLQEHLLDLTPEAIRGQVQGVESAGRMTWQGIGAVIGGISASIWSPAQTITGLAIGSLAVTVLSRETVIRSQPLARQSP